MPAQPAYEALLDHGGNAVILRASLRAAVQLDSIDADPARMIEMIAGQNLTTIRAVILATATDRREAQCYLTATAKLPLAEFLSDAQAACLAVVAALIQAGDDSAVDAPSQGGTSKDTKSKPWRDYFDELYRFGTGWLGWTPETVWHASPAELAEAFTAHADRLIAMNGGSDTTADNTPDIYSEERLREIEELGYDPAFDRDALRALKAKL